MNTIIELRFPEKVECVLTIVGTIADMKKIREQLETCDKRMNYPLSEFTKNVNRAIDAAEARWDSTIHEPEGKSANIDYPTGSDNKHLNKLNLPATSLPSVSSPPQSGK